MNGRDRVEVIMLRRKRAGSTPMEFSEDDFGDDNGSQVNLNSVGNVLVQRNAANARERARMRVLSSAFGCLKTKLPNIPPDTKLSKLDTLRLATIYIKQLKTIVDADDNFTSNVHMYDYNNTLRDGCINLHKETTTNMNWPFGFYHHHYQHHHHQQQQQQQQNQYNQNNISINSLPTWPNGHSCSVLQNLKHNSILTTPNECIGDFVNKNSLTHLSENYKNDQNSWYMMESADSTKQLTSKYPNISNHHIHHLDQHHHNHHKQNNATLQIWCNQRNHQGQQEQQEHHLPHYSIQEVNNRINIYPQRHQ